MQELSINNMDLTVPNLHWCAWRRYIARLVDVCICTMLFWGVFTITYTIASPETREVIEGIDFSEKNILVDKIFTNFLCIIFLPLSYYFFGNTIGKKLLGIKIVDTNGKAIAFKKAINREILVFLRGVLFYPISGLYQYRQLIKNKATSWDNDLELTLIYTSQNFISIILRISVALLIFGGTMYIFAYLIVMSEPL